MKQNNDDLNKIFLLKTGGGNLILFLSIALIQN